MSLSAMRKGAKSPAIKALLFGLTLSAVCGLVLMDVGGFFRSGGVGRNTVASIGGEELSATQFDRILQQNLAQQGIDARMAYKLGLVGRYLNTQIANMVFARAGRDLGLVVSDDLVAAQVNRLIAPFVKGDEQTKKDALRRVLMSQGMSEGQFAEAIRTEMSNSILRNAIQAASSMLVSAETGDLYRYENEERTIKAVVFPDKNLKGYEAPSDDVLLPLYQAGHERYAIPETRRFTAAILSSESIKDTLAVSDESLKAAYEKDKNSFTDPERRILQQAILDTEDQARAVIEKTKAGKSLKDSVAQAGAYKGEETYLADGLAKEIADPAFQARKKDVIGPIKTALGWHVLFVKEILPPKTRPFEEIKETLRNALISDKRADSMQAAANAIDDELAGGAAFDAVARDQNLKTLKFGPLRADGSTLDNHDAFKGYDAKDRAAMLETAFQLSEGENSPVQQLADGRFAVVHVDSIKPKGYKPFEEVKAELSKTWIADQQSVLNRHRVEDALRTVNTSPKTLEDIAKENGLKVETVTFKRKDNPPAPLNDAAKTVFFETDKPLFNIVALPGAYILGQTYDVKLPSETSIPKEGLKSVEETTLKGVPDEFMLSFLDHMGKKYGVKVNADLLKKMYGPVDAAP